MTTLNIILEAELLSEASEAAVNEILSNEMLIELGVRLLLNRIYIRRV